MGKEQRIVNWNKVVEEWTGIKNESEEIDPLDKPKTS
jgi:hypothetical protein